MSKKFSGKRKINGVIYSDSGYHGASAKVKQKYYQKTGARTRIIKIKNPSSFESRRGKLEILLISGGRSRRKNK